MDEGPGSFHLARLKVIAEGPEMRVSEEATVGVVRRGRVTCQTALIVAHLRPVGTLLAVGHDWGRWRRRRGSGSRLERWPLLGAVLLVHKVLYAMLDGVIGQVAPAAPRQSAHAAFIHPQSRAVLLLPESRVWGDCQIFSGALDYLALQTRCQEDKRNQKGMQSRNMTLTH